MERMDAEGDALLQMEILEVLSWMDSGEGPREDTGHSWDDVYKLMLCGGLSGAIAKTCTAPLARLTILYQVQGLGGVAPPHPVPANSRPPQRITTSAASSWSPSSTHKASSAAAPGPASTSIKAPSSHPPSSALPTRLPSPSRFVLASSSLSTSTPTSAVALALRSLDTVVTPRSALGTPRTAPSPSPFPSSSSPSPSQNAPGSPGTVPSPSPFPSTSSPSPSPSPSSSLAPSSSSLPPPGRFVYQGLRTLVAREGFSALYRGNIATILHRIPYSAANFSTYELAQKQLQDQIPNHATRSLTAGGLGSGQLSGGIRSLLHRILKEEGGLGLYKGLGATLMQVVPSLALNFCLYDTFKRMLSPPKPPPANVQQHMRSTAETRVNRSTGHYEPTQSLATSPSQSVVRSQDPGTVNPGPPTQGSSEVHQPEVPPSYSAFGTLGAAMISAFATSSLIYPLDLIRRRMQVSNCGKRGPSMNYWQTWRDVYIRGGGVRAFYCGIAAEYCKVIPGMTIAFVTFEAMKDFMEVESSSR
eukprot:gene23554-9078_t